jgi:hypothetical protein
LPGVEVAYDGISNPEILVRDWVAESQLEQQKVQLKGYQSAVTSVIFEVTNKQPIAFSQFGARLRRILGESTMQPKTAAS